MKGIEGSSSEQYTISEAAKCESVRVAGPIAQLG